MTDEKKELQETIKTIESARDFLLDITEQIAEKLRIPIEKLSESFEQIHVYEIPKGMVCKFWDSLKNSYYIGIYNYYDKLTNDERRHVSINNVSFENCTPAWDLIFDILGIPEEYKYAACDSNGCWYAYRICPVYGKSVKGSWSNSAGAVDLMYHPHPDPENSLQERK